MTQSTDFAVSTLDKTMFSARDASVGVEVLISDVLKQDRNLTVLVETRRTRGIKFWRMSLDHIVAQSQCQAAIPDKASVNSSEREGIALCIAVPFWEEKQLSKNRFRSEDSLSTTMETRHLQPFLYFVFVREKFLSYHERLHSVRKRKLGFLCIPLPGHVYIFNTTSPSLQVPRRFTCVRFNFFAQHSPKTIQKRSECLPRCGSFEDANPILLHLKHTKRF